MTCESVYGLLKSLRRTDEEIVLLLKTRCTLYFDTLARQPLMAVLFPPLRRAAGRFEHHPPMWLVA